MKRNENKKIIEMAAKSEARQMNGWDSDELS